MSRADVRRRDRRALRALSAQVCTTPPRHVAAARHGRHAVPA